MKETMSHEKYAFWAIHNNKVELFLRDKLDTFFVVSNCFRTPFPKFLLFNIVFELGAGLWKILNLTLKWVVLCIF